MQSVEYTGQEYSESVVAGRSHIRTFRMEREGGEEYKGAGSFIGRLLEVGTWDEVGEVRVGWTSEGDVQAEFPAMDAGRYGFAIDWVTPDGEVERFVGGWIGYMEPESVVPAEEAEHDGVLISVRMKGKYREAYVLTSSMAEYWAGEAGKASKSAEEMAESARQSAETAKAELASVNAFIALFNNRVYAAIVANAETGTWWIGGTDTGKPWKGKDAHSPKLSETGTWMVWSDEISAYEDTGKNGLGKSPRIGNNGNWFEPDLVTGKYVDTGHCALGRDGKDGSAVRRILVEDVSDIPQSGATCNGGVYYYVPAGAGTYDVYAWLEAPGGATGWYKVDLADDIATTSLYGAVKISSDSKFPEGGAIGRNEQGQIIAAPAGAEDYGSVKYASEEIIVTSNGIPVLQGDDGAMYIKTAGMDISGGCKISTDVIVTNGGAVGYNAAGQLTVVSAGLNNPGAVSIGSAYANNVPRPFHIGVGKNTNTSQLSINLLYNGALRHASLDEWRELESTYIPASYISEEYGKFFLGLATSKQFEQSSGFLKLNFATSDMSGAVFMWNGDESSEIEPSVMSVKQSFAAFQPKGNYLNETALDTWKNTMETRMQEISKKVQDSIDAFVRENEGLVLCADGTKRYFWQGSKAEWDALTKHEDNYIYFITQQ